MKKILEMITFVDFVRKILKLKVRDHCHLIGTYRKPAHSKCNNNVAQKQSIFFHLFFIFLVTMIVICSLRNWLIRRMVK